MLIKMDQKAEKTRRLKAEDEKPMAENLPIGYGKPMERVSAERVTKHYQDNFRNNTDWKPGRVSRKFRDNYDSIRWEK